MALWNRQPKRSVPEPVKPPQHGTRPEPRPVGNELGVFRSRVLTVTISIFALALGGYAVYGPWFSVHSITVSGTREIQSESVQRVTSAYVQGWRFGIVPNKNLWLLSRRALATHLKNKIRLRISIEDVRIVKKNRHDLEVVVVERTPLAVWQSGGQAGTIDRTGTIITMTEAPPSLPTIRDARDAPFVVGQHVLTPPTMTGWISLNDAFKVSTLTVEHYIIPVPTCPTKIIQPEDRNTNATTTSQVNLNVKTDDADHLAINSTNGAQHGNENTNSAQPVIVQTDCDLAAIAQASQELHAQLKDGPLVLFDRHQDLALAVQTVKRLLTNPDNSGATYIDIRFQERVYIK